MNAFNKNFFRFLTTCSFDFLTDNDDTRVFVMCIFIWAYCIPMGLIMIFYSKLYGHVKAHEKMLKEQAKKMNVQSLSTNKDSSSESVEIRIAKACFTIFFLFVCAWTREFLSIKLLNNELMRLFQHTQLWLSSELSAIQSF